MCEIGHNAGLLVRTEPKFKLGQVVITSTAAAQLNRHDVLRALERHATGDWGDLCPEDKHANELALKNEARILSAYRDRSGTKFWVITEWDRSLTTVLLPADY